jgi:dephospho-CoA kinase
MKKIIGLVGPIASGKDVAKKYIEEKYGAESVKFSQMLRDVLNRLRIPIERENMQKLSLSLIENFGDDIFSKNIIEDANTKESDIVILDGVRRLSDISTVKKEGNFILIGVTADTKIRYERMKKRNENEGDKDKTFDDFIEDQKRGTEIHISDLIEQADYVLDNGGNLEDLYRQIDEVVVNFL